MTAQRKKLAEVLNKQTEEFQKLVDEEIQQLELRIQKAFVHHDYLKHHEYHSAEELKAAENAAIWKSLKQHILT